MLENGDESHLSSARFVGRTLERKTRGMKIELPLTSLNFTHNPIFTKIKTQPAKARINQGAT